LKSKTERLNTEFSIDALSRILFQDFSLSDKTRFIVAYSGGCDSQVLLHGLVCLRSRSNIEVVAAHFDHGLQEQSATWATQCRNWCEDYKVRYLTAHEEIIPGPGDSIEAVARTARYRWLGEIAGTRDVVVTAHHSDDQAETFLLHLFQGKDIDQLAGITPSRPLLHGSDTTLVRPLLDFARMQLESYARINNLQWIEDPSNDNHGFYRNYIRQELMPVLKNRWPDVAASLNRGAVACRRIAKREREKAKHLHSISRSPQVRGVFCLVDPLALEKFAGYDEFEITGLIRYWVHSAGCASPSKRQLETFYHQVIKTRASRATLEFNGVAVRLFNGHLYLTRTIRSRKMPAIAWDLNPIEISELGVSVQMDGNDSSSEELSELRDKSIELAWRKGGEKIRLFNRKHHTSLKKVFQSGSVPPWERDCLPYLTIDEEIAWVHGVGCVGDFATRLNNSGIGLRFSRISD